MKWHGQKLIDVIQWLLIIGLIVLVAVQGIRYEKTKKDLVTSEEYNKQNTYVRIYESQKLDKLKRENKELYDSIAKIQDAESGMIIKFKEHYNTDTIKVNNFIVQTDTVFYYDENKNQFAKIDSVYHYTHDNDTVKLSIDIKASNLKWCRSDFTIRDKFVIVNREKDGVNQTLINHSDNTEIEGTSMWHRQNKSKWYNNFTLSPQIGAGYGITNKKFDIYVGFGIGYKF